MTQDPTADQVIHDIEIAELTEALKLLSPRHRQVIEMRYAQNADYPEIAEALSIRPHWVRELEHRAVEELRLILTPSAHHSAVYEFEWFMRDVRKLRQTHTLTQVGKQFGMTIQEVKQVLKLGH